MNILAINPWITDYAAYDFWLKPYGFLAILTLLINNAIEVDYIDCLEEKISVATFGRGKYYSEKIKKPELHKKVPRYFKRYGITPRKFKESLSGKNPDYILITSSMTYWYPGIVEAVSILKRKFPDTPIILGGTYATLCLAHAKKISGCDLVFGKNYLKKLSELLKINITIKDLYATLPDYKYFYKQNEYIVLRTSWGCPFSCSFCAIKKLSNCFFRIPADTIVKFISEYARKGIKNFVLYDDAFLYRPKYAKELLSRIISLKLNINFHTPNALHLRFLDQEIASLLKASGFINPHFGLETMNSNLQRIWGDKVNKNDLINGIKYLRQGKFNKGEFSIYLLLGYPRQNLQELKKDLLFLNHQGAKVSLAEFSPVPGTKIFQEYKDKLKDPILHNNSTFGFFQNKEIKTFWEIKNYARQLNKQFPPNKITV